MMKKKLKRKTVQIGEKMLRKNKPEVKEVKAPQVTVEQLLEKVGVCHRLGYGSGCNCLNECFIIRQHLDTKTY